MVVNRILDRRQRNARTLVTWTHFDSVDSLTILKAGPDEVELHWVEQEAFKSKYLACDNSTEQVMA